MGKIRPRVRWLHDEVSFNENWDNVKVDVLKAVKDFFKKSKLLREVNLTHICLIPKSQSCVTVEDYRPISLCNVSYKIIAKCIAERLKILVPKLISLNKTTFASGRKILESILLAQEVLKGFGKKKSCKNVYPTRHF